MDGEVMIGFPSTGENSMEYKILSLEKEAEQINSTFNVVTDQINQLQVEQQKLKQKVLSIKNQIKGLIKQLVITSNPNKRKHPFDGFSQDHPNTYSQNTFQTTPASNPFTNNLSVVATATPVSSTKETPMNIDNNNTSSQADSNEMMTEATTTDNKQSVKEKIEIKPTITNNNTNLSVLPDTNPKLFSIEIKDENLLQKLDYLLFEKNWRSEPTNQFFLHATTVIKSYLETFLPSIPSTHSTFVLKLSNQREKELSTNNLVQIKDVYLIYHKGLCFSENKVNIDNLQFWHEKKLKTSTMIGNVQLWSTTVRSRVEDKSNQLFGFISSRRVAHLPSSPLWLLYYFPKNMWQNSTAKSSPSHATNFVSPPHSTSSSSRASPPHYPHSYLGFNSTSARDPSFESNSSANNNSLFNNSKKNNNNNNSNSSLVLKNNNNNNNMLNINNNNNNIPNNTTVSMTFGDFANQNNNLNLNLSHDFKNNRMANPIPSPSLTNSSFSKFLKHSKGEIDTTAYNNCAHQNCDEKHADYQPLFSSSSHYYNDNSTPFSPMTNLLDYHPNNQIDFLLNSWDDRENSLYNFEGFGVSSIGQDFAHYAIAESPVSQDLFINFNKTVNDLSGKLKENRERIGERGGVIGVVGRNEKGRLLYTHNTEDTRCTHLTVTSPKYGFMSGRGNEEDGIGTADIGVIVVGVQLEWNDKKEKRIPKACSEVEPGKHILVASGLGDFLAVSVPMSELSSVSLKSVVAVPLQSSSQFKPDENGVIWISAFVHSTPSWLLSFLTPQPSQNNTEDISKMIEIYCAKEMEAKYQNYSKTLAERVDQLHLTTHQKIIEESKINVENQVKLLTSSLFSNSAPTINTPSSENLSARLSAIEKMINSELVKCIGDLSLSIKQSPSLNLSTENRPVLSEEEMKENQKIIESNYRAATQEFSDWKKSIDLSLTSIGSLKKAEIKEIEKIKEKLTKGIEFAHSPSLFLYSEILILSEIDIRQHLPFLNQVLKLYGFESNFLNSSFSNTKENINSSSNNNINNIISGDKENNINKENNNDDIKEENETKSQEKEKSSSDEKSNENDGKVFLIIGLIEFRVGNLENAMKFFKKSASAEYEESYYYLAECYYHSFGVPQNIKKAKRLYSKLSFNSELPQASAALGLIYYFGIGEELPNYLDAEKLFQFAVNNSAQANSDALYFLGMIKLQQKDYQSALIYLNMSSDKLNAKAQYQLALLYYEGNQFIPKNNQKAKKFLKLSSEQKYLPSFFALSSLFSI